MSPPLIIFTLLLSACMTLLSSAIGGESDTVVQSGQNLITIVNRAQAGDVIEVSAGSYPGGTVTQSGVTIRAANGATVKITDGVGLRADNVILDALVWEELDATILEINGKNNVIRNCTFRRFGRSEPSKAIWIRESGDHRGNVIEKNLFEDWGGTTYHSSCIKISQAGSENAFKGTVVRDNTIRRGAVGGNNPAIQPFAPTLIENNVIHDVEDGVETKGSHMIIRGNTIYNCRGDEAMSNRNGSHNLFERNLLYNIDSYAWQIWTGEYNVFRNNVIWNCGSIANVKGGSGSPEEAARHVLLINNTFYNVDRGIRWDRKKYPPRDIRFVNNIFVGDGDSAIESSGDGLYREDYNLFYRFSPPAKLGVHSLSGVDPLFIDPARKNFRLKPDSPASKAGNAKYAPPDDWAGNDRSGSKAVAIGAFEVGN